MMKALTVFLLFAGVLLWAGCGSGSSENGELPPPEEFDWPWLKTGKTLDLPELDDAADIPGGPETNMITVKAGTESPYHLLTTNASGKWMERSFELKELREVLRDARAHHEQEAFYTDRIIISAEKNASFKHVSDLTGAFGHFNHNKFDFQVAYPEGFEPDERFFDKIPHLTLHLAPIVADGFYAMRREQGADFYLTDEEIKALNKPKKDKSKMEPRDVNVELEDLPPPPELDPEELPPPPPPPSRAKIEFKMIYPGSEVEAQNGALYVHLVDGTTLDIGGKQTPLREFSQVLHELFPDISKAPPIVLSASPDATWNSFVEMLRVMRTLRVRKYAVNTLEHEAYFEYLKLHPEPEEDSEDLW